MTALAVQHKSDFNLTPEQDLSLFEIAHQMQASSLPVKFISDAIKTALRYEGVADLVFMWAEETDDNERNEIIADIQDLIDDCKKTSVEEYRYIKFNDLESVKNNIREFKDELLKIVDAKGGISNLAKLTGLPQPSLSRFFNSNSMPRRQTLLKIADALKLDAIKISTPWER